MTKFGKEKTVIKLNFGGSYKGHFERYKKRWKVVSGIFPQGVCERMVVDYDPKYDVNRKAKIGITWKGYGIYSYFSEMAGGGFSINNNLNISEGLMYEIWNEFFFTKG